MLIGMPPLYRIHTTLKPSSFDVVSAEVMQSFLKEMLTEKQLERFQDQRDLDFSTEVVGKGRFRVNAHYQRGGIAIAFRAISDKVPPLNILNLPDAVHKLINLTRGMILVTGDTGSGKSTTMASLINAMNHRDNYHIITLEDPIEYSLHSEQCVIEQREIGFDCPNFASGLKHALRQDPDVILVGEMRDLETTSSAITAAETGHLVISTLHTINSSQTIERIIDIYPSGQQNQIRSMLANTLRAVISQTLFKRIDVPGMVPAVELLICNSAVRNCIRENRIFEIPNILETSKAAGMQTLDSSIVQLVLNGMIPPGEALAHAANPEKVRQAIKA